MKKDARIELRKLQVDIMRDKISDNNSTCDTITSRMFTLLGGEIAITGLLSSSLIAIPFPKTDAGFIFLCIGIASIIVSLLILMWNYRAFNGWPSPMGETEVKLMNAASDELEALDVLYDDYRSSYVNGTAIIATRARRLNASLLLFVIGAILLLVLKFGG